MDQLLPAHDYNYVQHSWFLVLTPNKTGQFFRCFWKNTPVAAFAHEIRSFGTQTPPWQRQSSTQNWMREAVLLTSTYFIPSKKYQQRLQTSTCDTTACINDVPFGGPVQRCRVGLVCAHRNKTKASQVTRNYSINTIPSNQLPVFHFLVLALLNWGLLCNMIQCNVNNKIFIK